MATQPEQVQNEDNNDNTSKEQITSKFNLLEYAKQSSFASTPLFPSKNLIIVGSKRSGKSSIFNLLSSNIETSSSMINDDYSPTFGINYGFMRYQQSSSNKLIINIYEIGGGIENIDLLKTLITPQNIKETMIFIVVDFEKPETALDTFIQYNKSIRSLIELNIENEIQKEIITDKEKSYDNSYNKSHINIIPINTYIIGNKYDYLEKIDVEKIKWVCRCLRYYAHINGMGLIFHSNVNKKLADILKATVSYYAFGKSQIETISRYSQKNDTHAIYINYYNDKLDDIGDPKVSQRRGADNDTLWKESYESLFQQKGTNEFDKEKEEKQKLEVEVNKEDWEVYKESRIDNEMNMFMKAKEKEKENEGRQKLQKERKTYSGKKLRLKGDK